jgi:methylmalonyl-CoA mutase N-terminal domain/subunit
MYLATAEKQGADWKDLSGTIQNDILKEYIAQKTFIYPPEPSMRIITDIMGFASRHVSKWNTISISGYHIREAGSTAIQELAFTLRDGIEYVDYGVRAGLKVDDFAPRLSFFFDVHNDFFEEIAKLRAARRMWARAMKERFQACAPRSLLCRVHCQTAGVSLTAKQPYNNVVRVALQGLAAVLGGAQSLHTNSLDETFALPTEKAVTIALRTQQIIAHESGVANTIDPLGGSYFLETLTHEMEVAAADYCERIDAMGGMVRAIERGYPQREIQESSYQFSKAVERKEKIIVGVNEFVTEEQAPMDVLIIDDAVQQRQCARLKKLRAEREGARVERNLSALKRAAEGTENLMPHILDCVRSYGTLGEISDALRAVWGEYREPSIF